MQLGAGTRELGAPCRRRNELGYPQGPGDEATIDEVLDAVDRARVIVAAAEQLVGALGLS